MLRVSGIALLLFVLAGSFGLTVQRKGWDTAIDIWIVGAALTTLILLAVLLIAQQP
jgi:hypothetical protein